jgi:hypothetical protein
MHEQALTALRAHAGQIRERWEALLRIERVNTPLANPDVLIFLIPQTIEQVLKSAAKLSRPPPLEVARKIPRPECLCGASPYLSYFTAGEQALVEALVLVQSQMADLSTRDSDLAALYWAVRSLAAKEIEAFRGVCALRAGNPACNGTSCHPNAVAAPQLYSAQAS